jgi:nucleoid DNA-binding protein
VTKKEIVKQISDAIEETQLKTKKIVQKTFDAIVKTLVREGRIELRNFGVFEVKKRRKRKARNPRTGEPVQVPEKYVVTFKPGKKMEELVAQMTHLPDFVAEHDEDEDEGVPVEAGVGGGHDDHVETARPKPGRTRKTT